MKHAFVSLLLAGFAATPLAAQSQGDWTVGIGATYVHPKSDNGDLVGSESHVSVDTRLSITGEYFIRDNIGIELLASIPFHHDVDIEGVGYAGKVKHLPPTLSLNYHVETQSAFSPYFGIGVNYTYFFDEDSPLGDLNVDNSWGVAVQAGVDYAISDAAALRANIRWIDIDSDVKLNGSKIGSVDIDPWVLTFAYVMKF